MRILLLLSLLLLTLPLTVAELTINAPSQVQENQLLAVSFSSDTPENLTTFQIERDGVLMSTTNMHTWFTNYSSSGEYLYTFKATFNGTTEQESRAIRVIDAPLEITINSPEDTKTNDEQILIDVTTSRTVDQCMYQLGVQSGNLESTGSSHTKTVAVLEGMQTLIITCSDIFEEVIEERLFIIDKTEPSLSFVSPADDEEISGDFVRLRVSTNEAATCRYGYSEVSYEGLQNIFQITGGINHEVELDNLGGGAQTVYVACKDPANNPSSTSSRFFRVNRPPTAKIDIKGEEPLRQGVYEVTLIASEDLKETPHLAYQYESGDEVARIALTGEDRIWEGYLIVDPNPKHRVGAFTFSGTDNSGLVGEAITQGAIFLVDTQIPGGLVSFSIQNYSNRLELHWVYDGEEVERFNIYRSEEPGVQYVDKFAEVDAINDSDSGLIYSSLRDYDVKDAITYYYRIAAVDTAGNVGELSVELSASALKAKLEREIKRLDPVLLFQLEKEERNLQSELASIESAIFVLESINDPGASELIVQLDLLGKAKSAKARMESFLKRISESKELALSQSEVDTLITDVRNAIEEMKQGVVDDIKVEARGDYVQSINGFELGEGVDEFEKTEKLEDKVGFIDQATELQEKITVRVTAVSTTLRYITGEKKDLSLIKKSIAASQAQNDVIILEKIPEAVASSVSEINFFEAPILLSDKPTVQYTEDTLSKKEIIYTLPKRISLSDARATRTFVFPKPKGEGSLEADNEVTGAVSANTQDLEGSSWKNYIVLILGGIFIAGLLGYYFFMDVKPPSEKRVELKEGDRAIVSQGGGDQRPNTLSMVPQSTIRKRMQSALEFVNQNLHTQAKADYLKLLKIQYDSYPHSFRVQCKEQLNELYNKIRLSQAIEKGHKAILDQNFVLLSEVVDEMKLLATLLPSQQVYLTRHADANYSYFVDQLTSAHLIKEV